MAVGKGEKGNKRRSEKKLESNWNRGDDRKKRRLCVCCRIKNGRIGGVQR